MLVKVGYLNFVRLTKLSFVSFVYIPDDVQTAQFPWFMANKPIPYILRIAVVCEATTSGIEFNGGNIPVQVVIVRRIALLISIILGPHKLIPLTLGLNLELPSCWCFIRANEIKKVV